MKKRRYCIIALVAVLSLSLVHGVSLAQDEDEDLSVYQWGHWSVMVMPAAGPPLVFADVVQLPEGHDYNPSVEPPLPPEPVYRGYATHGTYQRVRGEQPDSVVWSEIFGSREPANIMISNSPLAYSVENPQNVLVSSPHPWDGNFKSGDWVENNYTGNTRVQGELIVGRTTAAINVTEGLRAGNVRGTISYVGKTLNSGDDVRFNFDFGAGTGTGKFGDRFTTKGNIVGAQFDSSSVDAIHPLTTAEGTVRGSFFGNDAGVVFGGLADVDIKNSRGQIISNYTEVFSTTKQ